MTPSSVADSITRSVTVQYTIAAVPLPLLMTFLHKEHYRSACAATEHRQFVISGHKQSCKGRKFNTRGIVIDCRVVDTASGHSLGK